MCPLVSFSHRTSMCYACITGVRVGARMWGMLYPTFPFPHYFTVPLKLRPNRAIQIYYYYEEVISTTNTHNIPTLPVLVQSSNTHLFLLLDSIISQSWSLMQGVYNSRKSWKSPGIYWTSWKFLCKVIDRIGFRS